MFETIQKASNKVMTAYGVSKDTYGGPQREQQGLPPTQGSGQGNGAGPACFVGLSSTGLSIQQKKGFGSVLVSCLSLIRTMAACFMFVDDDQYQQTATSPQQLGEAVTPQAQQGLDSWVGYLQCTGGAINPDKSYWYLLDYKWTGTLWRYRTTKEMQGEITSQNPEGDTMPLKCLEAKEAAKQLGIWTAPDGNQTQQYAYLMEKAKDFTTKIWTQSLLSRNEAWTNFTHTISKTMAYPMGATTFTKKAWHKLGSCIHQAVLPKAGIVRTLQLDVLYGPAKYQGMGCWTVYCISSRISVTNPGKY